MMPTSFSTVTVAEALDAAELDQTPLRRLVMIVDDERIIADTLGAIFSNHGYATLTEYSGEAALETIRAIPPDLLITDVIMLGMTGVELAIAVTKLTPECKILLFSGQAATVDLLAEARALGYSFDTMTKPAHPKDMLARVAECLAA